MKIITTLFTLLIILCGFMQKEITWVAIGDSITYLNDHTNETGNRVSKGFMTRVVEKLGNIHFINQGHNGWTSGNIAENIEKIGLQKADIYTVFLGTNDWWHGRPLGTMADYLENKGNATVYGSFRVIMNKLRSLNPDARIILITPLQRSDFVYISNMKNNAYGSYKEKNGQKLEQFANAVVQIARHEKVEFTDLYHDRAMSQSKLIKFKRLKDPKSGKYTNYTYPRFTDIPFDPEKDEYPYPLDAIDVTYDGLHPSDKGNEIIASRLVAIMKKYK